MKPCKFGLGKSLYSELFVHSVKKQFWRYLLICYEQNEKPTSIRIFIVLKKFLNLNFLCILLYVFGRPPIAASASSLSYITSFAVPTKASFASYNIFAYREVACPLGQAGCTAGSLYINI